MRLIILEHNNTGGFITLIATGGRCCQAHRTPRGVFNTTEKACVSSETPLRTDAASHADKSM